MSFFGTKSDVRYRTERQHEGHADGWGETDQDGPGTTLAFDASWCQFDPAPPSDYMPQMPDATPKLRVLVIDDSVDNAEALCVLLAVMGCLTAVAFSGIQGIAAAAEFEPHLAFIDLEMPGMGGCEVARHLRASDPKGSARLICLTGRGQPDDRGTCMDAGFDDFFTKPMAPESLAKVVAASSAAL